MLSKHDAKYVSKVNSLWLRSYSKVESLQSELKRQRLNGLEGSEAEMHAVSLVYQAFKMSLSPSVTLFDEQVAAIRHLLAGRMIEMANGEGKTFAAAAAASVACIISDLEVRANTVYIATQNDYLAKRDALLLAPLYEGLGLSVCVRTEELPNWTEVVCDEENDGYRLKSISSRKAHQAQIVHCSFTGLIFDYLHDLLAPSTFEANVVNRDFLIIDEADSVLLDLASQSHQIVSSTTDRKGRRKVDIRAISARMIAKGLILDRDFVIESSHKSVTLLESGLSHVEQAVFCTPFTAKDSTPWHWYVRNALLAEHVYIKSEDYKVIEGDVQIFDRLTGRFSSGTFGDGIHAAIQAKEGIPPSIPGQVLIQTSPKQVLSSFKRHAGLTASAKSVAREFRRFYGIGVAAIPRRKLSRLRLIPPIVCRTRLVRLCLTVLETIQNTGPHTPVLISTQNELDALFLRELTQFLGFDVNFVRPDEPNAEPNIVARAGDPWSITVASKLLSRGTEIKLAPELSPNDGNEVDQNKVGLHVVVCGYSTVSDREDQQVIGRTARRGAGGSARIIFSVQDKFPRQYLPDVANRFLSNLESDEDIIEIPSFLQGAFRMARRSADRSEARLRNRTHSTELILHELHKPWLELRLLLGQPDGCEAFSNVILSEFALLFSQDSTGSGRNTPGGITLEKLVEITGFEEELRDYREHSTKGRRRVVKDALLAKLALMQSSDPDIFERLTPRIRNAMDEAWSSLLYTLVPVMSSLQFVYFPHRPPRRIVFSRILSHWRKELGYFSAFFVSLCLSAFNENELRHPSESIDYSIEPSTQSGENVAVGVPDLDSLNDRWISDRRLLKTIAPKAEIESHNNDKNSPLIVRAVSRGASRLEKVLRCWSAINAESPDSSNKESNNLAYSEVLVTIYDHILAETSVYPECKISLLNKMIERGQELPVSYKADLEKAIKQMESVSTSKALISSPEAALLKAQLLIRLEDFQQAFDILDQNGDSGDDYAQQKNKLLTHPGIRKVQEALYHG